MAPPHRYSRFRGHVLALALLVVSAQCAVLAGPNFRPPTSEADLKAWLENMVWHHRFTTAEIQQATGLEPAAIEAALRRFQIDAAHRPHRRAGEPLTVLPYPGGRHPRIGFLDGAVDPQRETKLSVFTPWDESSYIVCDFPEALWSNLGLTYLAHTHIPTVWDKAGQTLPPLEWQRERDGSLVTQRTLPNGIRFATRAVPARDGVQFRLWLHNGSPATLTDLRVQNCVMLKGAVGFNLQTNLNKVINAPYVACRSVDGRRWVISGWEPCHRPWANPPVPCLHADPKFPDCPPGTTRELRGWVSFYEGTDIEAEFRRLNRTDWRTTPSAAPPWETRVGSR